jgi:hypothetical protein
MGHHKIGPDLLRHLPLGISSPLREAMRTGQLSPSGEWPIGAYQLIGRDDLAEGVGSSAEHMNNGGYKTVKQWLVGSFASHFNSYVVEMSLEHGESKKHGGRDAGWTGFRITACECHRFGS